MPTAPTQSNFLKLKKQLEVAEEGYSLLDQKREVMIMELMDNIRGYKNIEEELTLKLKESYRLLEDAFISTGRETLQDFSREKEVSIDLRMRSVMGIPVPELLIEIPELRPEVSLLSTDENFDKAIIKFREVIEIVAKWAAKEVLLWRLGAEINKTQKRVNALENIFIPRYKGEIKRIEEVLEEDEREEFFRRKRLKGRGQ